MAMLDQTAMSGRRLAATQTRSVSPAIRFGGEAKSPATSDTVNTGASLPRITLPQASQKDFEPIFKEMLSGMGDKKKKGFRLFGPLAKMIRLGFKIRQERKKADNYLPDEVIKRLKKYRNSPKGWYERFLKKAAFMQHVAVIKGPVAIKDAQAEAELAQAQLMNLQFAQAFTGGIPFVSRLLRWKQKSLQRTIDAYRELKDQVPLQPRALFEAQLSSIKTDFEKAHPGRTLEIGKAIGAGSIAQIFEGTITGKGQEREKVVIKVLRPDANLVEILAQRNYLYYQNLIRYGTDTAGQKQALEDADQTIAVLKEEIKLQEEPKNAAALRDALKAMNLDGLIHIPEFHHTTAAGFVQEYAGSMTLTRATPEQRLEILRRVAPAMLQLMLISPDKYLDLHDGNFIFEPGLNGSVGRISLLDFGRFARLDQKRQGDLLTLLASIYAKPSLRQIVKDENLHAAAEKLVNTEKNPQFKGLVEELEAQMQKFVNSQDAKVSRLYAAEQSQQSLDSLLSSSGQAITPARRVDMLTCLLTGKEPEEDKTSGDGKGQKSKKETTRELKAFASGMDNPPAGIFNAWANYVYMAQTRHNRAFKDLHGKLLPLSSQAVAPRDLEQIAKKFRSLFGPYFTHFSAKEREEAATRLEKLNLSEFRKLFLPLKAATLEGIEDDVTGFKALRQAARSGNAPEFQQALQDILTAKPDKDKAPDRDRLAQALLVSERLTQVASSLASRLTSYLPEASLNALPFLTDNLIDALQEDFKLSTSDFTRA